jgi:exonuclease VII small subunit
LVGNVLSHEEQIHLIQNKLRRHFNTTLSSYLCSTDFQSSLIRIHQTFNGNNQSTKYFKLLNLFDDQLRKHSIKTLNEPSKITTDSVNQSDTEMKQTRKIRRLERRLSNLSRIIRELEEKELSLDEMRYSDIYQVESKLKKQAYDVMLIFLRVVSRINKLFRFI